MDAISIRASRRKRSSRFRERFELLAERHRHEHRGSDAQELCQGGLVVHARASGETNHISTNTLMPEITFSQ